MNMQAQERRKCPRYSLEASVIVRSFIGAHSFINAQIKNVCLLGVCFQSPKQFMEGEKLSLQISGNGVLSLLHIIGEVVWSKQSQDAKSSAFFTGVRLLLYKDFDSERYVLSLSAKEREVIKSSVDSSETTEG